MTAAEGPAQRSAATNGQTHRPHTVLVLGGGGMKGFAHIGVIRALERLGIEVDEVVGTSMGAVMGAALAAGMNSSEIEEITGEISIKSYFKVNLLKFLIRGYKHASVYKGKAFQEFLQKHLPQKSFAELEKPFTCNALSLNNGTLRYFGRHESEPVAVADAVYSSSCLPGVFEPIEIDGDHYIDGGMTESLSLRIARIRRPDLIIAVDLSIREHHQDIPYRESLPHILFQAYGIMGDALNELSLHRYHGPDVALMKPKVAHIGILDEVDLQEIIRLGEREALEVLTTHRLTRHLCQPDLVNEISRSIRTARDFVELDVDMNTCTHCGICAETCPTAGFVAVPTGSVVAKSHNHECARDMACERLCPEKAITLRNL
ncbi:MAG: patatin-like phospholipase family protein [Planctomycetota bacterium]|nr:patatin-like phospholipase family protein [Planctomycetota bacterium]